MDVMQIVTTFQVSRRFATLGREVIHTRFNDTLRQVLGADYDGFRILLEKTRSVILASATTDQFIFAHANSCHPELRIATPKDTLHVINLFLANIGFIGDDAYRTSTTPDILVDNYDTEFWMREGKTITIVESDTDSPLPIVLAHRTTMDCMFITTGGMFVGFPVPFEDMIVFAPQARMNSMQLEQFITRGFSPQLINDSWRVPCGTACPMLWRRKEDARMVAWGRGTLPTDIFQTHTTMWRLADECRNPVCSSHFLMHEGKDLAFGPCCPSLASVVISWMANYHVSIFSCAC
jgi:hypothetical protein